MSMLPLHKKCIHCKHRYSYNPSVGKMGIICPRCKKINPLIAEELKGGLDLDDRDNSKN